MPQRTEFEYGNQSLVAASRPTDWTVVHTPAAAAQPTASKAANTLAAHVCTSIVATVAPGASAQTPVLVNLRDGATGAGTILWSGYLQAPANGKDTLVATNLRIVGTPNTAMTLEFAAAPVANAVGSVAMAGFDLKV